MYVSYPNSCNLFFFYSCESYAVTQSTQGGLAIIDTKEKQVKLAYYLFVANVIYW